MGLGFLDSILAAFAPNWQLRVPVLLRVTAASLPLAAGAALLSAATGLAANSRQCTDPCLQAARGALKECTSSAHGAFTDALDGCLERDHTCVDACRSMRQDCRDSTSVGPALAACGVELDARQAECRNSYPLAPKRRARCIYEAEVAAAQCRRRAFRHGRQELRDCRLAFQQCADACGPGGPLGGVDACKTEAKTATQSVLSGCRLTYQVTASACIDKDLTCTQGCVDAREACTAPTQATLDAAIQSCLTQEAAAIAACQAVNPGGGTAFQQCVTTAQASAATCRDAALMAAAPGVAACIPPYVSCVRGCPPA